MSSLLSLLTVHAAFAANIIHEFYVPLPEAQVKTALVSIEPASGIVGNTIESVVSIVVTGVGTVVHYDQWEDGYEVDLNNPTQSTTQIWGDGNDANGVPPGYAHDPASFSAGAVIVLRNQIPLPRNPASLFYDGRDRFGGTKALVVSRASWATAPGTVLCGANEVMATMDYGTNYVAPIGDDVSAASMFEFVGLFVMARDDNTAVTIDPDGAGATAATTITLNRGESYLVNGGIKKGATIVASKPVQAHLITGDIGARYESRRFTLYPRDQWSSTMYSPVGTAANGDQSYAFIYNPQSSALTINVTTFSGTSSFSVPANGVYQYTLPQNGGAKFSSATEQDFFGLVTVGANPTANNVHDWGFTMIPSDSLTSEAVVGWGPGSSDLTQNGSPAWVTPIKATRVYVDYNGDKAGSLTDPRGGKYDVHYDLGTLQTKTLYDPDKDQTAMRIYTLDGTQIAAAWGQDPAVAGPALPFLDCGTTVLPFPVPVLKKTVSIITDNAPTGYSLNDVIEYTVTVDNHGLLPLGNLIVMDPLHPSLTYVAGSTKRDGVSIPDDATGTPFPLDGTGYVIPIINRGGNTVFTYRTTIVGSGSITNTVNNITYNLNADTNVVVQPPAGSTPCGAQFTNSSGVVQSAYTAGTLVYATLTDPDANNNTGAVENITIVVNNTSNGDAEFITLVETGANTGVFRNTTGLATSATTGAAQVDGTLLVSPGNNLSFTYTDPEFSETCTGSASISVPTQSKYLYLSDPSQALDRVDPVATSDGTTAQTAVLSAPSTGSITATLSPSKDTWLSSTNTTFNYGSSTTLSLDRSGGGVGNERPLLQFDLSSIPTGAMIISAQLSLTKNGGSTGSQNVGAYRVTAAWDEGSQNGAAGTASWNQRQSAVNWTTAGGDYNATAESTVAVAANGVYSWGLTSLVQGWVDGSITNNGVLLGSPDTGGLQSQQFASRENSVAGDRPQLVVQYTTIGVASTSSSSTTSGTTLSFSHTPGSGSNRLLLVAVGTGATSNSGNGGTITGVTYNGATMNLVGTVTPPTNFGTRSYLYSLVNPDPGPANVVVTASGACSMGAGATTFTGVDQTTPLGTYTSTSNAASGTATATVSSADGEVVYSSATWDEGTTNQTITTASGQTELWNFSGLNFASPAASIKPGAASVTMTYTAADAAQEWGMSTVPIKPATTAGSPATFVQAPAFAAPFTLPAASTPTVTAYFSVTSGSMPASPNVTATLKRNSTVIATSSSASASGSLLTFTFPTLGSAVNFAASDVVTLDVQNSQSGVAFTVDYDSITKPSKITLPTTTVININSLGVYDAPYPGGSLITSPTSGTTAYVRAIVSDPFGYYDITGLSLSIDGPGTSGDATVSSAPTVATSGALKTFEYAWTVGSTTGVYNIVATTTEGTEGITDTKSTQVNVTQLDLGTPSTTEFTTGSNGVHTHTYAGNEQVYVRVTDLDQNQNASVAETVTVVITSASGDSEQITLTETGPNTGIFVGGIPASTTAGTGSNNGTLKAILGEVLNVVYIDPTDATDTSSDYASVPNIAPAISVNKTRLTPSDGIAVIGESISYQVQVTNTGNTTLTGVALTDTYPAAKLTYVSASTTPTTVASGTLTWTIGTLTQGQSVTITVNFTALATAAPATNSATATATGGLTSTSTANVTITNPHVTIVKTRTSAATANIGDNVTFQIVATNDGSSAIASLPIEDTFSGANFDFVSASPAPDSTGAGTLLWLDVTGAGSLAPAGTVTINVTLKAKGAASPAPNTATADYTVDVNGDPAPSSQSTATVTLVAAKITGFVYDDLNNSGNFTTGEPGIENVTVKLYTDPNGDGNPADGTLVAIATTSSTGAYEFPNLTAQKYVVVESDPVGYGSSGDTAGANDNRIPLNVTTLTTWSGNNFFDHLPTPADYAYINGKVINDANANGVDNSEAGLENISIDLVQDTNSNGTADPGEPVYLSTLTDSSGNYSFSNLPPGNYVVVEHDSFGWISTADSVGANNNQIPVVAAIGQTYSNKNFLDTQTGTVGGKVFHDANGNGIFDAGDTALANIDVIILDSMNVSQTVVTDSSGNWTATVPPGTTSVDVQQSDPQFTAVFSSGYTQTAGTDPNNVTAVSAVNTAAGDDGFRQVATITGHIYGDTNGLGTQNGAEPNLSGIHVVITDVDGQTQTVITDSNGNWTATVPPGSASANISNADYPTGSVITQGADTQTITAVANTSTASTPVGFYAAATVTGHLYNDTNGNGVQDGGETNLANIDIVITDSNGITQTVSTNASGNWTATVPPGTTTANINEADPQYPAGGVITQGLDTTTITAVAATTTGSTPVGIFVPATISGTVRSDNGHDGGGDAAYQGAQVKLFTDPNNDGDPSDGVQWGSTATTDATGAYTFTGVPPGNYVAVLQTVTSYLLEKDGDTTTPGDDTANASLTDGRIPVTVTAGEVDNGNDFVIEHAMVIGNSIFRDANGNNVFDAGEGVVGVKVQLFNSSNVMVDEVTSGAGGLYSFSNVTPGSYYVRVPASEFGVGKPLRGLLSIPGTQAGDDDLGEDGIDDAAPATNGIRTALFTVLPGTAPTDATTETGNGKTSDNADDANSDLTVDLGYTCPTITVGGISTTIVVGTPYSQTITASGGTSAYAFSTSDTLPAGLTLSSAGVLAGTPTNTTSRTFTVNVLDAVGCSATRTYTLAPTCPSITLASAPAVLPGAVNGTAYNASISASGGTANYSYAITAGALPNNLTMDNSGVITGTPNVTAASFTFTVTATDNYGCQGSAAFTISVGCPTITISPASLANGTVGTAYGPVSFTASGGTGPYTWTQNGSTLLPTGMTFNTSTAQLDGTPTQSGSWSLSIIASDSNGCSASKNLTFSTSCPSVTVTGTLPAAIVNAAYDYTLSGSGGTSAYTFSTSDPLPVGLTLEANGRLHGTPTSTASVTFTVSIADANGCPGSRSFTLAPSCPTITLAPTTLPAVTVNVFYTQTITASGGVGSYSFSTGDPLPAGLSLASSGVLSGTPTSTASTTFTVVATDSNNCTGSRTFTIAPGCPTITVSPASLPNGTVNTAYSQTITASGGVGTVTFATAEALPDGLTLETNGLLHGTPTSTTSRTFTVVATDSNGCTGSKQFTVAPACPTITLAPASLPNGVVNTAYNQTITASGGVGTYTFATAQTLPAGLVLETNGQLHGTPTSTTSRTFTVVATDANNCTGSLQFTIAPACPTITLSPSSLPGAIVGTAYNETVTATGGVGTYTFATSDPLPAGLTLETTGQLHGTPTSTTSRTFTIVATDANGCTGSLSLTLAPACPTISLTSTPAVLPGASNGTAYTASISASGGTATYSYSIIGGGLPNGLTMNNSGAIAGTPNAPSGAYPFTAEATDNYGCTGTGSFTISVNCGTISISPSTLSNATTGVLYPTVTFSTSGTNGTLTWSSLGTLPAGMTFTASSGTLGGTPTESGTFNFSVSVLDQNSCGASVNLSLVVDCPAITLNPTSLPGATVNALYDETIFASGGSAPYTYATTDPLPTGLQLETTGQLHGTPTSTISRTFVVTATDANGCTGTRSFTLAPACPTISLAPASLPNGTVNAPYDETITANGGVGTYTFATLDTLPTGLTLETNGRLHGAPTSTIARTFNVVATDANNCTGSLAFTLTPACPTISVGPVALAAATVNTAYSDTITASGGVGPYSFTTSDPLPAGLTLETNGLLHGTPTSVATRTFTVNVTDANNCPASKSFTITPSCPTITLAPASLPAATVNAAYDQTITASGGVGSYTFAATGTLPAGLVLETNGRLHGTPTSTISRTFTITATDANLCTGTKSFTLAPACPTITLAPASLSNGTVGSAYDVTITAGGGIAPYTFATGDTLPAGLTLEASGQLHGIPTSTTARTFLVTATDANGCTGSLSFTVTPACPTITLQSSPALLPAAVNGTAYSASIVASGGSPNYTYAVTGGALPNALTLASDGTISGIPNTVAGSSNFTVTATDQYGCQASSTFIISVSCPTITVTPSTLSGATTGVAYGPVQFVAGGGSTPYVWQQTGTLPTGITFNATNGTLDGTPTVSGTFNFSISATDTNGCSGNVNLTLTVTCPALTVTPISLAAATVNTPYSQVIGASGGTSLYSFSTGDALPAGLTLDSDGTLHGTPTSTISRTFTVNVTDANGCPGSRTFTLAPACPTISLAPASLPNGTVNAAYDQTITASGGVGTYTFATAQTLPTGLTLETNGRLHGTPTSTTSRTFTVVATDVNGCTGSIDFTIVPACPTISVSPTTLPNGSIGTAYNQFISASGGVGPYSFATAETLPAGLVLETTGQLHGTPTSTTSRTFTVVATDVNGCTGSRQFIVTPACSTILVAPANMPLGYTGKPYLVNLSASGGTAPYTYAVTTNTLPSGLTLDPDGTIHGTPLDATVRYVEITVTDANGCFNRTTYPFTTTCPTITINPNVLPAATVGTPYSTPITASGGTTPYTFSVTSGALPAGLTLEADGTLHGTPTSTASASFQVTVNDRYLCTGSLSFVLTPTCPTISLGTAPAVLPQGVVGEAFNGSIAASGGTGPFTFTVTSGSLPAGLTLNPNGSITGSPTGPVGISAFTVQASNAWGCTGSGVFAIGVECNVLVVTPTSLPTATVNEPYGPIVMNAAGATGAVTWSITNGSLPAGITLNLTTGELEGTPTATGTSSFTLRAQDTNGCFGTVNLSLTVSCPTISISPVALSAAALHTFYDEQLYATGGTTPYVFSITIGTLPSGLLMDQDGHITGTPTTGGNYPITVTVVDAMGCSGSSNLSINVKSATIHGHLYIDTNGNGTQDSGEPNLAGVNYTINESGGGTQVVATDSNGNWTATVPPGITEANVDETDPQFAAALPSYTQTEGNDPTILTVVAGSNTDFLNDGFYVPAQLHGHVYIDYNGNGTQDSGEGNLAFVTVRVKDSNNVTQSVVTDASGNWTASVPPGSTTVTVDETDPDFTANVPGSYTETDGTNPNTVTAVAAVDTNAGNDGYFIPGTLHGHLYVDTNGNGHQDSGEPNIANVDVVVTDVNLVPHTVSTDSNGDWTIQLAPGTASAKVQTTDPQFPAGVVQSEGTDPTASVVIINASVDGGTDGFKPLPGTYSISGQVRDDFDGDGNFSDNDTPVAGVVMKLWLDTNDDGQLDNGDALMGTTTTNSNGQYTFGNLSNGNYLVQEIDPRPSQSTADVQGDPHDNLVAVTVAGASVTARDFLDAVDPAGYIYDSVTGAIVPGGSISVSGPGAVTIMMNGSTGQYSFATDGTAGLYTITVTPPPGYRLDPNRPAHAGSFDPTGLPDPYSMGSDEDASNPGHLVDHSAGANVYYLSFDLASGDPLVINNNFPVVLIKPNTYTYWNYLTPGAGGTPGSNTDCDAYNDLLEYGLCGSPATAVQTRPLFIVQKNIGTGFIDASFKRPVGVSDVSYTLQLLTNLANSPAGWTPTSLTPVVTSNGDGSETVTYSNLESDSFFASSPNQGFARLKVTQLGAPSASATTETFGWTRRTANSVCESCSMPYLKPEIFAGCVDSVAGNTINVTTSAGTTSIATQFVSGQQYYIEVLSGVYEGQRFEVNEAASTATSIVIEASNALNTMATLPDLGEERISLRAHWLLGELFEKTAFHATVNLATADRLLFHNNATSSFTVYYRVGNPPSSLWFLPGGPATDQSNRIIDCDEGILVHPRFAPVPLLFTGIVRSNKFAMPILPNDNLLGSGWPMSETPNSRTLTVANGCTGNRNPVLADRFMFWKGDTSLTNVGWTSHFLINYNAIQQWVPQGNASLSNENNAALFTPLRACLMRSMVGKPDLVMPMPWTP